MRISSKRLHGHVVVFGWVVTTCCVGLTTAAEPLGQTLRPDALYQAEKSDPVTYEVDFSAVVTAPYHAKVLKVWMPIPPSDNVQQISDSRLTTFPVQVEPRVAVEGVYGNKFAYFEFHNPQGAQIIRHRFTATVANLRWKLDPARVVRPTKWPAAFQAYLQPHEISQTADFRQLILKLATNRKPEKTSAAGNLFQAMNWIDENLKYDHVNASLRADSAHAYTKRLGHCSDYHGLCATMGRVIGFPTRVTYGLSLFPKNSPSHCKLETFLPPYGWVSFDLSETQKMIQAIESDDTLDTTTKAKLAATARSRLRGGFRENSWLLLTRGTDYQLAPKAAQRAQVVRTIYAEADGQALPEPDPANKEKREFSWMTVHKYKPNRPVTRPFKDFSSLKTP